MEKTIFKCYYSKKKEDVIRNMNSMELTRKSRKLPTHIAPNGKEYTEAIPNWMNQQSYWDDAVLVYEGELD